MFMVLLFFFLHLFCHLLSKFFLPSVLSPSYQIHYWLIHICTLYTFIHFIKNVDSPWHFLSPQCFHSLIRNLCMVVCVVLVRMYQTLSCEGSVLPLGWESTTQNSLCRQKVTLLKVWRSSHIGASGVSDKGRKGVINVKGAFRYKVYKYSK